MTPYFWKSISLKNLTGCQVTYWKSTIKVASKRESKESKDDFV